MEKSAANNTKISKGEIWSDWAAAAQEGNAQAYRNLLNDIAPFIKNYLTSRLANEDWADDIAQEVLLSVHKSLKTYSPERPFRPWLIAIINFRRTDYLRKHYAERKNKHAPLDNLEFQNNYVTNPTHAGEYKDIEQALNSLPKKQRKILKI